MYLEVLFILRGSMLWVGYMHGHYFGGNFNLHGFVRFSSERSFSNLSFSASMCFLVSSKGQTVTEKKPTNFTLEALVVSLKAAPSAGAGSVYSIA